jgi:hypothetical protein
MAARYIVGIDLGTTNCAVAYVDTRGPHGMRTPVAMFDLPQLVGPDELKTRPMLPSFLYLPGQHDLPPGSSRLPWDLDRSFVVGEFAREQGARVPGRLISSAKSWLCHSGVDRRASILPWAAPADVKRVSPVDASAEYLRHIRQAWNATIAQGNDSARLEKQDIVLTVPASFDEVARDLTLEAAQQAGLPKLTLIEEPQAAFYAWMNRNADAWADRVAVGQVILVCDVGGGTTDFTLIQVDSANGKLAFRRLAVGDHLMLGGDNVDVALARRIEVQLFGQPGKLDSVQWSGLVQSCRAAKETLLGENATERVSVSVAGRSSKVIGSRIQAEVTRDQIVGLMLDGFLPVVPWDAEPASRPASGLQEFGLPYVADPAITRHLARFLRRHRVTLMDQTSRNMTRPDAILFNGGVLTPTSVRSRFLEALTAWFRPESRDWSPIVLESDSLDLAVARGAAHYGLVRRGGGVRIGGGTARTYYVGIESPGADRPLTVCVVPRGLEEGQELQVEGRQFQLLLGKPVSFPIYTSTTRMQDRPGDVIPLDEQFMDSMPPVQTTLRSGTRTSAVRTVPVSLLARYTELGTVELWCVSNQDNRRWRLQFQTRQDAFGSQDRPAADDQPENSIAVRSVTDQETFDESVIEGACQLIRNAFSTGGDVAESAGHDSLMKSLREQFGLGREQWPTAVLRQLWEAINEAADGRKRTPGHERRWMNMAGFCLRPGYGYPQDDFRVTQLWRIVHGGPVHHRDDSCRIQWWIMSRRIAAGLKATQQELLFGRASPVLLPSGPKARRTAGGRTGAEELVETWRLAASLSLISEQSKIELGKALFRQLRRAPYPPHVLWAVARIGARVPFYGPIHTVVNSAVATEWIEQLLDRAKPTGDHDTSNYCFALSMLARRSGDRHRDIRDELRTRVIARLTELAAPPHLAQLVSEVTPLDDAEQRIAFGDSLPVGLIMQSADDQ